LSVGKGAAYIYIELIAAALSGYILWLFLSKITTPNVIGTSSTIISLATILAAIVSLGIPNGIPRHLGKMFSEHKLVDARLYVKGSIFLMSLGIFAGSITILILKDQWFMASLDLSLIIMCILLMGALSTTTLFRYIVISSLRTRSLVSRQIVSALVKVGLSIALVLIGLHALGFTSGYTTGQIVATILLGSVIVTILKSSKSMIPTFSFKQSCKNILSAGFPSWLPTSITTIGSQAGTIIVFGSSGSSQAGTYFIAFSIFSAIFMVTSALASIALPALSAMQDGRKRFSWRITKISLIVSLPLACSLIFYSDEILGLLGQDYVRDAASLQILLFSILPLAVMTTVSTLVYAYGNYRQVLEIGLALSIPRAIFYFVFVPFYGGTGAALSFTLGAIIGFIMSASVARKVGFKLNWKDLYLLPATCYIVSFGVSFFEISYIIGIPFSLLISYLLLLKLRVLTREDIQEGLGVLPGRISSPAIKTLNIIGKKINRSY
jgi:O-antigen/teichoic acid export membrane protein